jgi:hypothetical protein
VFSWPVVTPEQRAKAVVEHFADMLPPAVRPQLESVIARAITRAINQELARLQRQRKPTRLSARTFQPEKPDYGQALVGKAVTIRDSALHGAGNAYPLPDGLTDGQAVTVLCFDRGYFKVKDAAGREWQVYTTNVDRG